MSASDSKYGGSELKRQYMKERNKRLREALKKDPAALEVHRAYMRQYRLQNKKRLADQQAERQRRPETAAWHRLQRKGIEDPNLIPTVLEATKCQICGGPPDGRWGTFHVDHCHETGGFRGMICHSCNTGLGNFKDDPATLRAAAAYLEKYRKMLPGECQ